eukprot:12484725-Alexandrium_andersonii.AAC.1
MPTNRIASKLKSGGAWYLVATTRRRTSASTLCGRWECPRKRRGTGGLKRHRWPQLARHSLPQFMPKRRSDALHVLARSRSMLPVAS